MPAKMGLLAAVSVLVCVSYVRGHGMMLSPINRASLWRIDWRQPANYEDNQFFCGGVQVQYEENGGRCGSCGDNYADAAPRSNENGGTYGNGIIVANYTEGQVVSVQSVLTANHLGSLHYSVCSLDADPSAPESEECFQDLTLADGSPYYVVDDDDYAVVNEVQLPEGLTCERCVFRWHYRCGNSWGICADGTDAMGCGDQEIFRSCADVSIRAAQ